MISISAAAARLAREVPQAEHDIDQAIAALSSLMNTMACARGAPGVAPGTGEMAMQHVGKALEGLLQASGEVAKAHGRLRHIGNEKGVADIGECPPAKGAMPTSAKVAA